MQATVICVDDSEWMRNGDYPPTRLQAQEDAANLVVGTKMTVRLLASLPPLTRRWIGLDWIFFLFGWGFDSGILGASCALQSNPENTVGVLAMAGDRVRVLLAPTSDPVKFLACMHGA